MCTARSLTISWGGMHGGGVHGRGTCVVGGMHDRGCMVGGCVCGRRHAWRGGEPPPPVNRMTDACKNITVSQTSFAGGKHGATPSLMPENCYFASYRYVGCALITLHTVLRWRLGVLILGGSATLLV